MIASFRSKALHQFWEEGDRRGLRPDLVERIVSGDDPPPVVLGAGAGAGGGGRLDAASGDPDGPDRAEEVLTERLGDLTPLVQRLMRLCLQRPEVIEQVSVRTGFVVLRSGPASLDVEDLRLADLC